MRFSSGWMSITHDPNSEVLKMKNSEYIFNWWTTKFCTRISFIPESIFLFYKETFYVLIFNQWYLVLKESNSSICPQNSELVKKSYFRDFRKSNSCIKGLENLCCVNCGLRGFSWSFDGIFNNWNWDSQSFLRDMII